MSQEVSAATVVFKSVPPAVDDVAASAWSVALAELERNLRVGERLLEALHDGSEMPAHLEQQTWQEPTLEGPVPAALRDRVDQLARQHDDLIDRLTQAMRHARAQRRAIAKLGDAEHVPVFFDTSA